MNIYFIGTKIKQNLSNGGRVLNIVIRSENLKKIEKKR